MRADTRNPLELSVAEGDMVDHDEELLDERDARTAAERLADIRSGRSTTVPFDEAMRQIGLSEDELGR